MGSAATTLVRGKQTQPPGLRQGEHHDSCPARERTGSWPTCPSSHQGTRGGQREERVAFGPEAGEGADICFLASHQEATRQFWSHEGGRAAQTPHLTPWESTCYLILLPSCRNLGLAGHPGPPNVCLQKFSRLLPSVLICMYTYLPKPGLWFPPPPASHRIPSEKKQTCSLGLNLLVSTVLSELRMTQDVRLKH